MSSASSSNVLPLRRETKPKDEERISFQRRELDMLLQFYSARVGTGEWRDYAIDMLKDRAVFSVFKRASEVPVYTIEKMPKLARKQGEWCVVNANGLIMKRGHELKNVLKVLDKKPKLVSI
ncbi:MAG: DUF2794 domain-containing protein [Pseudomonadota bacterium]